MKPHEIKRLQDLPWFELEILLSGWQQHSDDGPNALTEISQTCPQRMSAPPRELFATADGGVTWRGLPATMPGGRPKIKFADSTVGWVCLGNDSSTTFSYTSDGGKRWNSREIRFPSGVGVFSLPSRDRGYVVGKHGMVYRYRIVPMDYTSKGMMAAPGMFTAP